MKRYMSPLAAVVFVGWVVVSSVQAGMDYADPAGGWDYTYDGTGDAFGSGGFTALDGTWNHSSADDWDGSKPGAGPLNPPASPVPGGVGSLPASDPEYLRIQDTGKPKDWGWSTDLGENKKIYFAHQITDENGSALETPVLTNGMTLSVRARLATDGPLDDIYIEDPPSPLPPPEPWPSGGKGYEVSGDGRGMFGVEQDGTQSLGFALALDAGTPDGIGGGLIMNNQTRPVGTSDATPETVNLVPFEDADLVDWHEFWITVQDSDADGNYEIDVYSDGSLTPDSFSAALANAAEYDGQSLVMGLSSGSNFGAVDIDFFSYTLGVVPPEGELLLGDVNQDSVVNGLDVDPFVGVLLNGPYQAEADMNEDGVVNGLDVDSFVTAVVGGGGLVASVPEPSGLGLTLLAAAGLALVSRGARFGDARDRC